MTILVIALATCGATAVAAIGGSPAVWHWIDFAPSLLAASAMSCRALQARRPGCSAAKARSRIWELRLWVDEAARKTDPELAERERERRRRDLDLEGEWDR